MHFLLQKFLELEDDKTRQSVNAEERKKEREREKEREGERKRGRKKEREKEIFVVAQKNGKFKFDCQNFLNFTLIGLKRRGKQDELWRTD